MDLISVIIPVYNISPYLARCVQSVTEQTYPALQILLIDDGATDDSGAICDALARGDSRIEVIHKVNGGLSDARNCGIQAARGRYIAFIDGDDFVAPAFLETLHNLCVEQSCQIAQCSFQPVSGDTLPSSAAAQVSVYSNIEMLEKLYTDAYVETTVAWNKLYEADLFSGISYPIGKLHEDEATTYKLLYAANAIAVTEEKLYAYYQTPGSIMRRSYDLRRLDMLTALKERAAFFEAKQLGHLAALTWEKYYFLLAGNLFLVKKHVPDSMEVQKALRREIKQLAPELLRDSSKRFYLWLKIALVRLMPVLYMRLRQGRKMRNMKGGFPV